MLAVEGPAICESEWGKALGRGLYEFRIRKSLDAILKAPGVTRGRARSRTVLLRVFCAFERGRVVLLLGGYDKRKDPSGRRQQREIAAARRVLAEWKRQTGALTEYVTKYIPEPKEVAMSRTYDSLSAELRQGWSDDAAAFTRPSRRSFEPRWPRAGPLAPPSRAPARRRA